MAGGITRGPGPGTIRVVTDEHGWVVSTADDVRAWHEDDDRRRREEAEAMMAGQGVLMFDPADLERATLAAREMLRGAALARIAAGCAPERVWRDFEADLVQALRVPDKTPLQASQARTETLPDRFDAIVPVGPE